MCKFYVRCPFTGERYGPYVSAERADKARQLFDRNPACGECHEVEAVFPPKRRRSWIDRLRGVRTQESDADLTAARWQARAEHEPVYPDAS